MSLFLSSTCDFSYLFIILKYRLFGNEREFINGRCRTISDHFFANCINIFHKTEVQTVILMCLMGQNLNWSKSYDTKCTLRLHKILAKSEIDHQNLYLRNVHFTTISSHFVANYIDIFRKNPEIEIFVSWLLTQLQFRPVKHLKMTVWTSVLWKICM